MKMSADATYKNWKIVTEADYVSLFIKTWFAYISTLRTLFPEAYNRRGDKKYLDAYKKFYRTTGHKKIIVDENIMALLKKLYNEGRNIILQNYPEYYLWDFYYINESFDFTHRNVPPDKSECFIVGLRMNRNRGTKWNFIITGFVRLFGEHYGEKYDENLRFQLSVSSILNNSPKYITENPMCSEQDYLSWLLEEINNGIAHEISELFNAMYKNVSYGKRVITKIHNLERQVTSTIRGRILLNLKDESNKSKEEMELDRNTYEIVRQRPLNYFLYLTDVAWRPARALTASEEQWYNNLSKDLETNSILWFLDFVYRLRNALFHEIIDPLDEEWQVLFKNAYLLLRELVDLNIRTIQEEQLIK